MGLTPRSEVLPRPPSRFGEASSMSGAEMRSLVESIGLTRRDAATLLEVSESSVARWWSGQVRIPVGVADAVYGWADTSGTVTKEVAAQLEATGTAETYQADDDLPAASPALGALFHRVAAARALAAHNQDSPRSGHLQWADPQ